MEFINTIKITFKIQSLNCQMKLCQNSKCLEFKNSHFFLDYCKMVTTWFFAIETYLQLSLPIHSLVFYTKGSSIFKVSLFKSQREEQVPNTKPNKALMWISQIPSFKKWSQSTSDIKLHAHDFSPSSLLSSPFLFFSVSSSFLLSFDPPSLLLPTHLLSFIFFPPSFIFFLCLAILASPQIVFPVDS